MTPDQISKLPPELQPAAELCEKATPGPWISESQHDEDSIVAGTIEDSDNPIFHAPVLSYGYDLPANEVITNWEFVCESSTALPLALTYCLQMQEERDVFAQVAKQNMDSYVNEQGCRAANQTNLGIALEKLSTAEATIATLTRERDEARTLADKWEANASRWEKASGEWQHAFKNFHRSLCERFGYFHDGIGWQCDQVSLEEHIARKLTLADTAIVRLHNYLEHWPNCSENLDGASEGTCDCGLTKTLAALAYTTQGGK